MNGLSRLFWGAMFDKVFTLINTVFFQDFDLHFQCAVYCRMLFHLLCCSVSGIVLGRDSDVVLLLWGKFWDLSDTNCEDFGEESRWRKLLDHIYRIWNWGCASVLDSFYFCQPVGK